MYDRSRPVSHAFGLMARNALIASLERCAWKAFFRTDVVFERKIVDFPFKNNVGPIDFLHARLLNEAKNGA